MHTGCEQPAQATSSLHVPPLMSPVRLNEQIQHLVDRGCNLDAVYAASGDTPLCIAASTGQLDVMRLLLDRGADPDGAAADGRTPLYDAALNGQAEAIKLLLSRGAAVDGVAISGSAPLHAAALRGHTAAVKILLDSGATVNKAAADGITALHCAAFQEYLDIVQLLSDRGAMIDLAAADGITSLHHAGEQSAAGKAFQYPFLVLRVTVALAVCGTCVGRPGRGCNTGHAVQGGMSAPTASGASLGSYSNAYGAQHKEARCH